MASNPVKFRINHSEFDAALRKYAALSRHTPAIVCNRKAYHIVRKAIWYTQKADYAAMASTIGPYARAVEFTTTKKGKPRVKHGKLLWTSSNTGNSAPALALIINRRRGLKSQKGLYGKSMAAYVKKVWGARARSIAYIKSGWITAREKFKRYSGGSKGLPPNDAKVKQLGKAKGSATAAVEKAWKARAVFANEAWTKRDHKQSVIKYGTPALERAFAEETADTMKEVERRLRSAAHESGIKTN